MTKYTWDRFDNEDYEETFSSAGEIVERVLQVREPTRNDDKKLEDFVWDHIQEIDWTDRTDRRRRLSSATIKRRRQEIQEEGEYLPTEPDVLFDRNFSPSEVADCYSVSKPRVLNNYMKNLAERVLDDRYTVDELEKKFGEQLNELRNVIQEAKS